MTASGKKDEAKAENRRWTIGWKTPTLMATSYALACLIAVVHGVFYIYLTDKPADGPSTHISQTYSSTTSVILAGAFGLTLRISLDLSFTQYLWRVLRLSLLKTSTIERLFTMRSSPLFLFDTAVFHKAWPLVLITILCWSVPIAVSFPPGSMTVVPSTREDIVPNAVVPTFNASDAVDGPFPPIYMIDRTLTTTEIWDMPSPCGSNCSYTLQFTGPYFECKSEHKNITHQWDQTTSGGSIIQATFPTYNGSWSFPPDTKSRHTATEFANVSSVLHIITAKPSRLLGAKTLRTRSEGAMMEIDRHCKLNITEYHLECIPSRAEYTVHTTYRNNTRNLNVSINPTSIHSLTNVLDPIPVPRDFLRGAPILNASLPEMIRDINLLTLIQPVAQTISGVLNASTGTTEGPVNVDEEGFEYFSIKENWLEGTGEYNQSAGSIAVPLIHYFSLSNLTDRYLPVSGDDGIFMVNETALNSMLFDITLSVIPFKNLWTTHVNQTRTVPVNVYSFSRPLNLILPYSITAAAAFCVLLLGLYSLRENGVSATDGGFLQLLTTTRGSVNLERIARGGCLGGEENVPSALNDLKIQYGELAQDESLKSGEKDKLLPRQAGFGIEGEVCELNKDRIYGG